MDKTFNDLVQEQRTFFNSGTTKRIDYRKKQLKKLKALLKENEQKMMDAIHEDFKKSSFDTFTNELALVYLDIDEAIHKLSVWSKRRKVKTNLLNFPARSFIQPEPLGVSLIIGAWNYPFQLSFAPAVAAIAAGCTVILKPSEVPARTSQLMSEMISSAFESNFFHVVQGGVEETTKLLDQDWDKIFFTGSVPVGKIVYQAAAKRLIPVTLELGGKSPAFVSANSNLDIAVRRIVWGKFLNAGQTCIAPDYVIVEHSIQDKFIAKLIERINEMDFNFEKENYVQIINEKNLSRLERLVDNNKVCFGGTVDKGSRYFEPTLLKGVTFEDEVMQDEIFGPILPIITYEDLDDAVSNVKRLAKPLSCYVFSNSKVEQEKILNELSFGGGAINDTIMHITNSNLPFGGVGNSGIGSYHGKSGFDAFTHYKSVLNKATWLDPDLKYPPYSKKKQKWVRWLLGT